MEMNKKKYRLVIFDVDGTLLDTSEGLINSTIYTIKQLGYQKPPQKVLNAFVGPRIQDSFQEVYGLNGKELEYATSIFRKHYKEGNVLLAKPYNGVYKVLEYIHKKEIHLAVATNKRQDFVDELMEKYKLNQYFKLICGTDMMGNLKKVDLINQCINSFADIFTEQIVMIGDSSYDAVAAQEAGINFIGVTYGFDFRTEDDVNKWSNVGYVDDIRKLIGGGFI